VVIGVAMVLACVVLVFAPLAESPPSE